MTIVSMSLRRAIPRRVALQQSSLLLHQPPSSCHNNFRSSCFLQRTVPCPLTPCLTLNPTFACAVKGAGSQRVKVPPGNGCVRSSGLAHFALV